MDFIIMWPWKWIEIESWYPLFMLVQQVLPLHIFILKFMNYIRRRGCACFILCDPGPHLL